MSIEVQVEILVGELLKYLILNNPNRFGQTTTPNFEGVVPDDDPCPQECPGTSVHLTADDLRLYVKMVEHIHAYELLAVFAFIDAAGTGRGAGTVVNQVLSEVKIKLEGHWESIRTSLPEEHLPTYLDLCSSLRCMRTISLYRTLEGTERDRVAIDTKYHVSSFYRDVNHVYGRCGCHPTCSSYPDCIECDTKQHPHPGPHGH